MAYYPVFIELKGRRVLVIGGGRVAEGKVAGLLAAEAEVTLVAPSLTPALQDHASNGRIRHEAREYRDGDLDEKTYDLCFVATDDGAINARVAADAREAHVMVNAADDPANCDFILPAVVRRGDVVIAASTGGTSPALARRLREELTAFLDEDYEPLATPRSQSRPGGGRGRCRASRSSTA
ncbi:MAG TPA: bifunctional precorrin-2 dehydrogenase/sirohydrochlorin ferrochelatase, partial [Dehalococcoidia bacterium]|nr:bifunctional precorrin-2 dehydrogenase/sirohydrochlorin ferrochelatase [Dehalococcoidia bacterium]